MTATPWGKSQYKKTVCRGINFYSTSSHGGFHVSKKKNELIPEYMRDKDGWYEEDCAWSIVATCFPSEFNPEQVISATKTLMNDFPEMYEKFYGIELKPGESSSKDLRQWFADNKNKHIVTSAFGDWNKDVPKNFVGVVCLWNGENTHTSRFLIPKEIYDNRSEFGFAFDADQFETWNV